MQNTQKEIFENMSIPKAVTALALPTVMGMLVTIIYNLADTFFVGQLKDANQVAAVTIAAPIFMVFMSLGGIFGIGGGSYISRLLGQKKIENCRHASAFAFYGTLLLGVFCITGGFLAIEPILKALGANSDTWEFTKSYVTIFMAGAPFVIMSFAFGQIVRAEGAAKEAMFGMMVGTVANIILDPIFIFTFRLGVAGAAYATVIANILSALYYVHYCIKRSYSLSVFPKDVKISPDLLKNVFVIGFPSSLNQMLFAFSVIILNNFAESYGNTVIAALGIVSKATMIPIMVLIGLCVGVQPLIGYNYAAGNHKRQQEVMRFTAKIGTLFGIVLTVIIFAASPVIISAFLKDVRVIELGSSFLRVNIISVPFLCTLFLMINTFQALGKAIPSMILSVSRQGFIFIPVLIIANTFIGLKGIVWAQPVADILSTLIAVMLYFKTTHKALK